MERVVEIVVVYIARGPRMAGKPLDDDIQLGLRAGLRESMEAMLKGGPWF